jgi:hypothetical protein
MEDSEPLSDNDIEVSSHMMERDRESRFVVDFTVGPPGAGPVTNVTPNEPRESSEHLPPVN